MQCTLTCKGYIDQQKIWTVPDLSTWANLKMDLCVCLDLSFILKSTIARTNFLLPPPSPLPLNIPRLFLYVYLVHTGHIHTFLGFPEVGHLREPERIMMVNCWCNNMKTLISLEYCMDHKKRHLQLTLHRLYSFLM